MPHVSKRRIKPEVQKELLDSFEYILNHSSKKELEIILNSLMTETEKLMVAKRLGIAYLISEDVASKDIDEFLKVTRFTVGKIQMVMSSKPEGFFVAFKKIKERLVKEKIKESLWNFAEYVSATSVGHLPRKRV